MLKSSADFVCVKYYRYFAIFVGIVEKLIMAMVLVRHFK